MATLSTIQQSAFFARWRDYIDNLHEGMRILRALCEEQGGMDEKMCMDRWRAKESKSRLVHILNSQQILLVIFDMRHVTHGMSHITTHSVDVRGPLACQRKKIPTGTYFPQASVNSCCECEPSHVTQGTKYI